MPKRAIWRGCESTGLRERVNSSIASFPWAPSQGSRGPHCSLGGALSWQAPEMFDASKEVQGTSQSRLEWWEEVSLGVGMGGMRGSTPGCTPVPSPPPEVSSARTPFALLRVPETITGFKDPGLWSLTLTFCTCFFLTRDLRFSELILSFKSSLSFFPK